MLSDMVEYTSIIVETMKSMYDKGLLKKENVENSYNNKVITLEEYHYILGKEDGLVYN